MRLTTFGIRGKKRLNYAVRRDLFYFNNNVMYKINMHMYHIYIYIQHRKNKEANVEED